MRWIATTMLALTLVVSASADVLTTKSGRSITGTVVEENEQSVTFVARSPGVSMREVFKRSDIASITKPQEVAGPSYIEIPIMGLIGREVSAKAVADALAAARQVKAGHVVLLFDSPGGLISECNEIIEVMDQNRDLETVAFVKNAQSAAAVIAVTCKTIVMHPMGQIGAAVPFMVLPDGKPADVNEKLTSAFRARARSAAAIGGHDAQLLMGMIDMQVELYLTQGKGGAAVTEQKGTDGSLIKAKDKILTLTAQEATKYGLAKGIARTMPQVATVIGIAEWTSCGQDGWDIMRSYAQAQHAGFIEGVQAQREGQTRENAAATIGPLKARVREAEGKLQLCQSALEKLEKGFRDDTHSLPQTSSTYKAIEANYQNLRNTLEQDRAKWQAELEACKKALREMAD